MINFITKWWRSFRGQPFLNAQVVVTKDGKIRINVDFNKEFIAQLDARYVSLDWWKQDRPNNAKVALLLNDIFSGVADPYLPEDPPEPIQEEDQSEESIPLMAVRGGQENVTRVDVDQAQRYGQPYRSRNRR